MLQHSPLTTNFTIILFILTYKGDLIRRLDRCLSIYVFLLYRELVAVAVIMVYLNTMHLYSYPTPPMFPFKRARME